MADESAATTMAVGTESSPDASTAPVETTSTSASQAAEPTTDTQQPTTATEATTPEKAQTLSPRDRLKAALADPEIDRAYREHLNAEAQRIADKKLRRERLAKAKDDPVTALEFAQAEYQSVEAEETRAKAASEAHARVNADLADLWRDRAWAAEYEALRTGAKAAEFNKRYATDPAGFVDWADEQVTEARIEARANEKAKEIARAMALEKDNARLLATPQHPLGTAGKGQFTIEQIERMDSATYKANEAEIDRQFGIKR